MANTAGFTAQEIIAATGAELVGAPEVTSGSSSSTPSSSPSAAQCIGVSTDTRTLAPGNLYIPLKGPNFDGHDFIEQAFSKGAWGILKSKNTLKALGDLAAFHRRRFKIPVVAITGSSGKTTTKELLATITATRYNVLKTEANYNNEIGLPLMLLAITPEHEVAIFELGLQKPGEIKLLAMMATPTIGIVTNVGPAHREYFETVRDIALSKSDLFAKWGGRELF